LLEVCEKSGLAVRTGRAGDDLVSEEIARLLAEDEWFNQQVQLGMDQIARGEFLEEEQKDELVERMLRS
jgi:predicted transcriptional regulator